MPAFVGLWCAAGLLAVAAVAIAVARSSFGTALVYGASLLASLGGLGAGLWQLLAGAPPAVLSLAIGLPGLGAHFRLDALAAFFLVVANLGGALASLYALGYGRNGEQPGHAP